MSMKSLFASCRVRLREFGPAQGGNVAMTFALASLPVLGLIGAAVDYSRANSAKSSLQAAVDAATLTLSKDAAKTQDLPGTAFKYVQANFNRSDAKDLKIVKASYEPLANNKFKLTVAATAKIDTTLTGMWRPDISFGADSQAIWGFKKLELALALDNTGSMSSSGKMTQLKIAAKNLITTLKSAAKAEGDIKISIIPFDTTVNLGNSYKDNEWFDWDEWDKANGSCSDKDYKTYNSCIKYNKKWTPKNHSNWEGCLRDRTYPYDTNDNVPNISVADSLFPTADCGSLTTLMPLTSNWTNLTSKIDSMSPNGMTNVTIGLVWAWHSLTTQVPLTQALAPNSDLDKVVILLTDGDNTEAWDNKKNEEVTKQSSIDARTQLACTNIKAAGIKLYTIRVINGNANLLRSCATNTSMYYDVQDASQLNVVFTTIANSLANLRLAE